MLIIDCITAAFRSTTDPVISRLSDQCHLIGTTIAGDSLLRPANSINQLGNAIVNPENRIKTAGETITLSGNIFLTTAEGINVLGNIVVSLGEGNNVLKNAGVWLENGIRTSGKGINMSKNPIVCLRGDLFYKKRNVSRRKVSSSFFENMDEKRKGI